jgi:2-keto-3-deoxy-L-rhamnonate aldolase RhmA
MDTTPAQLLRNRMREKLARDEPVIAMIVRLVRGIEIAQIAATAGFDALYVDMEHSGLSFDGTGQICMAAQAMGVTPLVRVPAISADYVARVLDLGALGVIAPQIRSAGEARQLVDAAKFPPLGHRSYSSSMPQFGFRSVPPAESNPVLDAATLVIPMIETVDALDQVEEIASVDGVDMLLVGPNDLSAELGAPGDFDNPRLHDAFRRVIEACRSRGKHAGIGGLGASRPDLVGKFVELGARYISVGSDIGFLTAACIDKARQVRAALP